MIQLNFIFIQFIYNIEKYRNIEINDLVLRCTIQFSTLIQFTILEQFDYFTQV